MADLPEDDGPTMSGTPGERLVAIPPEGDADGDTTAAQAQPLTADQGPAGHEEEDRTFQQLPSPPPVPPPPVPPPPVPPPKPLDVAPRTSPSPSQDTLPSSTEPEPEPIEVEPELLEPIEEPDIVTATAPSLDARNLPLTIPGAVEIRTVGQEPLEPDDSEVKTEVRYLPNDLPPSALLPAVDLEARPPRPAAPRPAAGVPVGAVLPPAEARGAEDEPDSVTTEATAPRGVPLPQLDPPIRAPSSASMKSSARVSQPEEPATRPGVEEPPTRPGVALADPPELPTSPGIDDAPTRLRPPDAAPKPEKSVEAPIAYDGAAAEEDESVTTRAPVVDGYEIDDSDSVTTQAPVVPVELANAAVADIPIDEDSTDGTTQRVKKVKARSSPADSEVDSITTQAPGNLTNMLRVIAADDGDAARALAQVEDDEPPENRTAVMANAPIRSALNEVVLPQGTPGSFPPIRPTGPSISLPPQGARVATAAAQRLHPTSESGLRVARQGSGSGEHASLGAIGVHEARTSGVGPTGRTFETGPQDPRALAGIVEGFGPRQPSLHDVDLGKGPPYGLIVGIVLVVSLTIPATLFFVLNRGDGEAPLHTASTASSDFQKHVETPRGKHDKNKKPDPAASASASASASPSATAAHGPPGKPPPRSPFRR